MAVSLCPGVVFWLTVVSPALSARPFGKIVTSFPQLSTKIEKLEPCQDYQSTPIQFKDLVINQVGFNKFVLNGKINISEPLEKPIRIEVEMHRCAYKDNPDSCEYYFTFRKDGICEMLERDDNTWEYFTSSTDLPRTCPFPVNSYTVGGSIELKDLKTFPFFKSHWRLKNKVYHEEKLMFCLISEVSLDMVNRH